MARPESTASPAERTGAGRGGLSGRELRLIVAILIGGVALAALLMFAAPRWLVRGLDYPCLTQSDGSSETVAVGVVAAGCLGSAGSDGIDDQALSEARSTARTSFSVLSAALLAGAAAAIGVVVSNHNAALTLAALKETAKANENTKKRDEGTAAREGARDRDSAARDRVTAARDADTAARERERAADDRYTTAIDQLGHASASVRLGGMHSLHRLAEGDKDRRPTVIDVLCAYLRQPFHHPDHDWYRTEDRPEVKRPARAWWPNSQKERDERDSEREVRSTAARLMPTLLPIATTPHHDSDASRLLEINLSGAILDSLDLSGRSTRGVRLNGAHIAGDLHLADGTYIDGNLHLTGIQIGGDLLLTDGARINGDLLLDDCAHIDGELRLVGAEIFGRLLLDDGARIGGDLWLDDGTSIAHGLSIGSDVRIDGDLHLGHGSSIGRELHLIGTRIGGHLLLGVKSGIGGHLLLDDGVHVIGDLRVGDDVHIAGNLRVSPGSRIDGQVRMGGSVHIDGEVQLDHSAGETTAARGHD